MFLLVCSCVPLGVAAALRGWSLDTVIERFALNRWALALAGCAVVACIFHEACHRPVAPPRRARLLAAARAGRGR